MLISIRRKKCEFRCLTLSVSSYFRAINPKYVCFVIVYIYNFFSWLGFVRLLRIDQLCCLWVCKGGSSFFPLLVPRIRQGWWCSVSETKETFEKRCRDIWSARSGTTRPHATSFVIICSVTHFGPWFVLHVNTNQLFVFGATCLMTF